MSIWGVLREAASHYRRLFWRALFITAVVFLLLNLFNALVETAFDVEWAIVVSGILASLTVGFGDLVVEGALAHDGRDLHEGLEPEPFRAWERVRPLIGVLLAASIVYAAASNAAAFTLVVPAAVVPDNWWVIGTFTAAVIVLEVLIATLLCLIVPVIVLENRGVRSGFLRSAELVRGNLWRVLVVVVILFLGEGILESLCHDLFHGLDEFWAKLLGGYLASLIAVPYVAHALAVLYYRLASVQSSGSSSSG